MQVIIQSWIIDVSSQPALSNLFNNIDVGGKQGPFSRSLSKVDIYVICNNSVHLLGLHVWTTYRLCYIMLDIHVMTLLAKQSVSDTLSSCYEQASSLSLLSFLSSVSGAH